LHVERVGSQLLFLRQYPIANLRTTDLTVEIPFGFKRVWHRRPYFSDCAGAENLSLKAFRLIPTEPRPNWYAWKSWRFYNDLKFLRMRTVGFGSLALGLLKTRGGHTGAKFCGA
jgi:hypothetical protein